MKKIFLLCLISSGLSSISFAQIPVTDYALNATQQVNLQDSLINTAKSVARTLKQIEQYQTQLQQYQTQLMNLKNIPSSLLAEVNSVYNQYKQQAMYLKRDLESLGGIDGALDLFKIDFQLNPCLTGKSSCSVSDRTKMIEDEYLLRQLQNAANKDFARTIELEENNISKDARTIDNMNKQAMNIQGNKDGLQSLGQLLGQLNQQTVAARATMAKAMKAEAMAKLKKDNDDAESKEHFDNYTNVDDVFLDLEQIKRANDKAAQNERSLK